MEQQLLGSNKNNACETLTSPNSTSNRSFSLKNSNELKGSAQYQMWLNWFNERCNQHFESQFCNFSAGDRLLWEAMSYSMKLSSKRFRPLLYLATLDFLGKPAANFFAGALSVECVHTFSLIHDDLPAMDNDDFRRGQPSNHKVFGEALAILAGDSLFNYAYQVLINDLPVTDSIKLKVLSSLISNSGHLGIMAGQALDILAEKKGNSSNSPRVSAALKETEATQFNSTEALKRVQEIHKLKTGALIESCVHMAALTAEASPESTQLLLAFSRHLGMCFQIVDDILDETADFSALGKTVGKDKESGKLTFVSLLGIEGAKAAAQHEFEMANRALTSAHTMEQKLGKTPTEESFLFLKYLLEMVYLRNH